MCGIVGYIRPRDTTPIILNGLKRLEYRGYDLAGLAVLQDGEIQVRRDAGKLARLESLVAETPLQGNLGIGHTRWATHGEPSARNAHPHLGMTGDVVVVHNGIVENFLELRAELGEEGVVFNSDTDSEVIVHLIERHLSARDGLAEAARHALAHLKGAHGIVVFSRSEPDKIIATRMGNAGGVVIGIGQGEMFVASDLPAILEHTRNVVFLESRQIAVIRRKGVEIQSLEGKNIDYAIHHVAWDPVSAEKGEYRHFMAKEIHEQVRSLTDTIGGRVDFENGHGVRMPELNLTPEHARRIRKIFITACGTASHAGMVGKMLIEHIARLPVEVDIASEFRYRDPIVDQDMVVLAISQSGETADTLAAMEEGRRKGATLWSIVNAIGSQAMRLADGYISMQSGPEIGVASTKAYTAPLVDLYMLAILLADLRGRLSENRRKLVADLRLVPDLVGRCLDREQQVEQVAKALKNTHHCLYLGRGINMPTAYEGALKLKEISYIHAEGYPAGEMKHGPIALIDRDMPVVVIAPRDPWYEKMFSQIEQAKARGGSVIALATDGDEQIARIADHVLWIPETPWMLSPVTTVIPFNCWRITSPRCVGWMLTSRAILPKA